MAQNGEKQCAVFVLFVMDHLCRFMVQGMICMRNDCYLGLQVKCVW